MPGKDGETSVYRIPELSQEAIWSLGKALIRKETLKARADIVCSAPQQIGLRVESSPQDHPKHAVIVGWPVEKDKQKMLATRLSDVAALHIFISAK